MKWYYRCPVCNQWRSVEWERHGKRALCHVNKKNYIIPGPRDQFGEYVDQRQWPEEMEKVVVHLKGTRCTVCRELGFNTPYETLDHRIPFAKKGKTSVANLFPMCEEHNLSKADNEYTQWLAAQKLASDLGL